VLAAQIVIMSRVLRTQKGVMQARIPRVVKVVREAKAASRRVAVVSPLPRVEGARVKVEVLTAEVVAGLQAVRQQSAAQPVAFPITRRIVTTVNRQKLSNF
jgi:hypothetical protein